MSDAILRGSRRLRLKGSLLAAVRRGLLRGFGLRHNETALIDYPEDRWDLVPFPAQKGPPYVADNLATVNDSSFLREPRFGAAHEAATARWGLGTRDIRWRLHTLLWAVETVLRTHPEGALVELGTGNGYMAAGACRWLDWGADDLTSDREFWLVDSFAADRPDEVAAAVPRRFYYADGDAEVREYFAGFAGVNVVTGWLPGATTLITSATIAFVHVDLNNAETEIQALDALVSRLLPGAFVLFDDSGNPGCGEQLAAHRAWAARRGSPFLQLPSGQGLCIIL